MPDTDVLEVTFIILLRQKGQEKPASLIEDMVGDVNMFLSPLDTSEDDSASSLMQGELEIMIAEPSARRKGCATEALSLMIRYALANKLVAKPEDLLVRIGERNTRSIEMFGKLGFEVVKRVAVFEELEMRIKDPETVKKWSEQASIPLEMLQC